MNASGAQIRCPRCEETVIVPRDKLTPTAPPTLPHHLPLEQFLRLEVGHRCDPARIRSLIEAEYA